MTLATILRRIAGLCSAAAAAIHFGVTGAHFHEWWLYGVFFLLLAAYQLWFAAISWQNPSRRELIVGVGVNAAVVVLWLVTRTTGLPVGPDAGQPEAFGTADLLCAALELVLVVLAGSVVLSWPALQRSLGSRFALVVVAVAAGAALGSSGLALAAPQESAMHDEDQASAEPGHGAHEVGGIGDMGDMGSGGAAGATNGERHQMSDLPDVSAATPAQTTAARTLLTETERETSAYRDITAAQKAGYDLDLALRRWHAKHPTAASSMLVKELHVPQPALRDDGKVADPAAPETLIYSQRHAPGTTGATDVRWTLIGVMYVAPNGQPGPTAGGPYTRWHFHDTNDDGTPRQRTGYMMHVWFVAPDQLRSAFAMTPPVPEISAYQRSLLS